MHRGTAVSLTVHVQNIVIIVSTLTRRIEVNKHVTVSYVMHSIRMYRNIFHVCVYIYNELVKKS
jgi:hypothetical protein